MKITDFRLETYLELMDRPLGDANGPEGDDLIVSNILIIDNQYFYLYLHLLFQ